MPDEITPCLWYDSQALEAAELYVSLFPDSRVQDVTRYGEAGPGPAGAVMFVELTLRGRPFTALNGGPQFAFTPAVSLQVPCRDQEEVDRYWEALSAGGEKGQCGWLTDRYGLSWRVFPTILVDLVTGSDREVARRVMAAMMEMEKIEVAPLLRAAEGVPA